MCSSNMRDFDDWQDITKLREEVEAQKARVANLQSEQKWMKNSFSASDLCGKTRIDRSDSGIDRQSLMMDGRRTHDCDSNTNIVNPDCSTNSIKKIIEITSLIRAIEQQLNLSQKCSDTESIKTYSSTCSMPRCFHELPEQDYSNSSWIHNQLVALSIEQEKLSKQLNHCHTQIFKIENVKMVTLLNGMTPDQLKKRIDEYYKLKTCLTELATSATCNGTAMITVVRQLEPIAQSVEQYFRLTQEMKNIQNQIGAIVQRKNELQNKRCQLMRILQTSSNHKPKTDGLPQSASWNEPSQYSLNPPSNANYMTRLAPPRTMPDSHPVRISETSHDKDIMEEILKSVTWPPFNGDGTAEEHPPAYDESVIVDERKLKCHSRSLCHEYVNEDMIRSRDNRSKEQNIELMISSFPYESITIVQVKSFKVHKPLQYNQQYRARLLQLNGEGSDWNTICVSDDGTQIFISPYIMLPIKWSFNQFTNLTLLLELQMFDKGIGSPSNCFMFNIVPLQSLQNVSVPLHSVQTCITNTAFRTDLESPIPEPPLRGSLKILPRTSTYDDALYPQIQPGMHLLTNPILNRSSPPIHYSSIRRSQTYSHDHQYCGNFECCSSIDFVSEPIPRINQKYFSQPFNSPQSFRSHKLQTQTAEESGCISSNSSFKRQSIFRQPIRLKRSPSDREVNLDHDSQTSSSDHQNNEILIQELWSIVCDLYLALNSCSSPDERLLEFAYFRARCPTNLMKLYDYFVETIFDPDHN